MNPDYIPSQSDFEKFRVTNPNYSESIKQPLYDYQLMPGAGSQMLSFFQAPIGQGVTSALGATVGSVKTLQDTNMALAGILPSGLAFLALSIEVMFYAGSVSTANTYTPAAISFFAAAAAATVGGMTNDVNIFYQGGLLRFKVLAKDYVLMAPLINFVPRVSFDLQANVASNSATAGEVGLAVMRPGGDIYELSPAVSLFPTTNFGITLEWPAAQALPSGFNARVGVMMNGWQFRAGQ